VRIAGRSPAAASAGRVAGITPRQPGSAPTPRAAAAGSAASSELPAGSRRHRPRAANRHSSSVRPDDEPTSARTRSLRSVSACALSMTKCTASGLSCVARKPVGCGPAVTAAVTVNTDGRQLSRVGHRDARGGGTSPGVRRIPPSFASRGMAYGLTSGTSGTVVDDVEVVERGCPVSEAHHLLGEALRFRQLRVLHR
jgi:hypothetical protein